MKVHYIWLITVIMGCAQVKPPTGGPTDSIAPSILSSIPTNGATGFSGTRISIEFDERIQLVSPNKNILISPPLKNRPVIRLGGAQRVDILLDEDLKPDVTYTINLAEGVQDLTEGNPATGAKLVFSTGDVLDSAYFSGEVLDAYTLEPQSETAVILYPAEDTGQIRTSSPYYLTRTDKEGQFNFSNLADMPYRIYALGDLNGNRKYDLPDERIAFLDSVLVPMDSSAFIQLRSFIAESAVQRIRDYTVLPTWGLQILTARATDSLRVIPLNDIGSDPRFIMEHLPGSDTSIFWPVDTTLLKGQRLVVSDGDTPLDTIVYRPSQKMPFYVEAVVASKGRAKQLTLRADRPIASVDTTRLGWLPDSLGAAQITKVDSIDIRTVRLSFADLRSDVVRLLPGAFSSFQGGKNDTLNLRNSKLAPNQLGSYDVTITSLNEKYVLVQLMNMNGEVVRETAITEPGIVKWVDLQPGEYRLRLIMDTNRNDRWDTGSFDEMQQPEFVIKDSEVVMIRAGWQLETNWP